MKTVTLGKTGINVNKNGFGALPIQRVDFDTADKILKKAYDNGINFYDTARFYTDSEEKIGRSLSSVRDKIIIASKTMAKNGADFEKDLNTTLKLLKTDYLDIYQFHDARVCYKPGDGTGLCEAMEKAKKAFAGREIQNKKIGVIGLGAIGVLVANAAHNLNMEVYGYDPFLSVKSAWNLSRAVHHVSSIDEIFENCDFITIHVPLLDSTKNMISAEGIAKMKKDAVILNFARNGLVDEDALVAALDNGKLAHYVTDFPTPKVAGVKGVIAFPHLGASTEESEDNCAEMAVDQLMDYLENGNITNSVNYPNTQLGVCQTQGRIAILHRNIPNMLTRFTGAFAKDNINITEMSNKTKGDYAYAIFDVDSAITEESVQHIIDIEGVLKVRVVK